MSSIMSNTNIGIRQTTIRTVWGVIEKYKHVKGLTNSQLATKVGVSESTISNRRNSTGKTPLEELLLYKQALDIPDLEFAEALIGKRIIPEGAQ